MQLKTEPVLQCDIPAIINPKAALLLRGLGGGVGGGFGGRGGRGPGRGFGGGVGGGRGPGRGGRSMGQKPKLWSRPKPLSLRRSSVESQSS